MMAYATKAVLGGKRFEASEVPECWEAASDGSGRTFWFNEVTHETTYTEPTVVGHGSGAFSPQAYDCVGASPAATPFDGGIMSPVNRRGTAPPAIGSANGYMSPPPPGICYMSSPPIMTPPSTGYVSRSGSACMTLHGCPCHYLQQHHRQQHHHHHQQQQQQQQQLTHYPVETRSPCFAGEQWEAVPQQRQLQLQLQWQGQGQERCDDAPFTTSSSFGGGVTGGYRWEECYKQAGGKKFWRHRDTGVVVTKDPYR